MRKITLLFGAGAALPWGAPSTEKITDAINNSNDHQVEGKSLGIWINEVLRSSTKHPQSNINFETYIDFMESVYTYLTDIDNIDHSSRNNLSILFKMKEEIEEGISKLKFTNNSTFASNADKVAHCFYSLIRITSNQITKYLGNYENTNLQVNSKLKLFCEHFIKIGFSLRAYTLNYDRSIPLVFENSSSKYEIFDGFDLENLAHDKSKKDLYFSNKSKILNDTQCHSFYNLHGSFHWTFQDCDYKLTRNAFAMMSTKRYKFYHSNPEVQDNLVDCNPNEKLLQSQIITGYKKAQRLNLEPFNYFFHNFFNDLHQSEIIIIVGFSFSDPHISKLIEEAMRRNVRIYNITYKSNVDQMKNGYVGNWGIVLKNYYPEYTKWHREVEFCYFEYPYGFEAFLLNEEWLNIQPL